MVMEFLLCAAGLVVLSVAADQLVQGSSRLAAGLRINPVVVGIVVIGLGTSAPEFLVSASAAARGDTDIAVGNIVGSNVLNLTLILGVAALIAGVRVKASVVARETRLAVVAVAVFAVVAWGGLSPLSGVLLIGLLVVALLMLIEWARSGRSPVLGAEVLEFTGPSPGAEFSDIDTESADAAVEAGGAAYPGGDIAVVTDHPVLVESVRAFLGLGGVLLGAQLLVVNASSIATRFGVSQVVIGLTLVALGTSLPELVTTVQAQRRGESDLVVGNLFGSNLFNSLGGGAVVGLVSDPAAPAKGPRGVPDGHGRDRGAGLASVAPGAAAGSARRAAPARDLPAHPAPAAVLLNRRNDHHASGRRGSTCNRKEVGGLTAKRTRQSRRRRSKRPWRVLAIDG